MRTAQRIDELKRQTAEKKEEESDDSDGSGSESFATGSSSASASAANLSGFRKSDDEFHVSDFYGL